MTSDPSDAAGRNPRLEAIILAYLQALDAGQVPDRVDLLARHPDLATELTEFFAAQDGIAPLLAPLRLTTPTDLGDHAFPCIPGYEVLHEIGRGGMGIVYKARQTALNRVVALKMILAGAHADAEQRLRFVREAEVVARLDHPHVVQIHEIGNHDGQAFLALEFIDGPTLAELCANLPQDPRWAAGVVKLLARAVHHAHTKGVVHRDLKPGNVMLAGGTRPKVMDFGLARQVDAGQGHTQTGHIIGTPSFMAPEQAASSKQVGPAADVYALGAILYDLLTGRPPFLAATMFDTLQQVVSRAGAGAAVAAELSARSGDDLSEMSAQGPRQALRQRGRPGGRPAAVPGPRADHGAAGGNTGTRLALVPAQPGGGGSDGGGGGGAADRGVGGDGFGSVCQWFGFPVQPGSHHRGQPGNPGSFQRGQGEWGVGRLERGIGRFEKGERQHGQSPDPGIGRKGVETAVVDESPIVASSRSLRTRTVQGESLAARL